MNNTTIKRQIIATFNGEDASTTYELDIKNARIDDFIALLTGGAMDLSESELVHPSLRPVLRDFAENVFRARFPNSEPPRTEGAEDN